MEQRKEVYEFLEICEKFLPKNYQGFVYTGETHKPSGCLCSYNNIDILCKPEILHQCFLFSNFRKFFVDKISTVSYKNWYGKTLCKEETNKCFIFNKKEKEFICKQNELILEKIENKEKEMISNVEKKLGFTLEELKLIKKYL